MKYFIVFFIAFLLFSCKQKTAESVKSISEEETKNEFIQNENFGTKSDSDTKIKLRPRLQELEWYVGKWIEAIEYPDGWFEENPKQPVELEIKNDNEKYMIILNENGKISEGELYIDKYFLPKNISEQEKSNYDSRDFIVADVGKLRYWIGISYGDEKNDRISLNLGDIDVYLLKREKIDITN